ncbi:hypothetical protein AVEN_76534-1 [Araneus ventricosus]|uniref:Ionotropic glutamate receptor L-glutamate and glycine-binding domain-containing protein n=1 Tax=Araneus ventricosus TaxID=182803 RepID=A0A4Y2CE36_ARAVE|nr:hypothetical protein AVEN_76534-1 [Araneus ventricosus]
MPFRRCGDFKQACISSALLPRGITGIVRRKSQANTLAMLPIVLLLCLMSFNLPPYVIVTNSSGVVVISGFMHQIVRTVAKWMNISLSFIKEPDDNYGTWVNNSWSGMVGMLYRNNFEYGLVPSTGGRFNPQPYHAKRKHF